MTLFRSETSKKITFVVRKSPIIFILLYFLIFVGKAVTEHYVICENFNCNDSRVSQPGNKRRIIVIEPRFITL